MERFQGGFCDRKQAARRQGRIRETRKGKEKSGWGEREDKVSGKKCEERNRQTDRQSDQYGEQKKNTEPAKAGRYSATFNLKVISANFSFSSPPLLIAHHAILWHRRLSVHFWRWCWCVYVCTCARACVYMCVCVCV